MNKGKDSQMPEKGRGANALDIYTILLQRESQARNQFIWAFSGFFLLNSLLTWVFFMSLQESHLCLFPSFVAGIGIAACIVTAIVLLRFASVLIRLSINMHELAQDPYFGYMQRKGLSPLTDVPSIATRRILRCGTRALACIPLAGILLWIVVLAESLSN